VEQHFWRFREAGLGNYKPETPQQRKAVKALKERPEGGYAFVGVPQRGKTHLLVAQYRMAGVKYRCELRSSMQLIAELQQVQVDEEARSPILEALQERRLRLLWDDIDKVSFDKSSFRVEMVFELIDEIWRMELPLSVTSNVPIRELQEVGGLSPAAARRLMDLCLEVPL
jgi:DNA replication protein DnaC